MKRLIDDKLLTWKEKDNRKPLYIYGARKVGKTYSVLEFAKAHYANVAYFHFANNQDLSSLFSEGIRSIDLLVKKLEAYNNQEILADQTLIVFDEIQSCPEAITSLKRFYEERPDLHVIALGSLLGVALHRNQTLKSFSFPVGKIEEFKMYPLTFEEFLYEMNPHLVNLIKDAYINNTPLEKGIHETAINLYYEYLFVGGYPEIVYEYSKTRDFQMIRSKQLNLYNHYISDMNKYVTSNSEAIKNEAVYQSIPSQIAKPNRKFQYSIIKSGARASQYETSLDWLEKANIIIKCSKVSTLNFPLAFYKDRHAFKVYMSDIGLYNAKCNYSHVLLTSNHIGPDARGAISETYVAQELYANGHDLYYWESNHQAEIDFLIELNDQIIPIEVKSKTHVRSQSLEVIRKQYKSDYSIRISLKNFGFENGIKSVPLYAVFLIK